MCVALFLELSESFVAFQSSSGSELLADDRLILAGVRERWAGSLSVVFVAMDVGGHDSALATAVESTTSESKTNFMFTSTRPKSLRSSISAMSAESPARSYEGLPTS